MKTRTRATIARESTLPPGRCVAVQTESNGWGTIYRGADHMRCTHTTPLPAGFHRCEGENGCPSRLRKGRYCFYHNDLRDDLSPKQRMESAEWGGPQPYTSRIAALA